MSGQPSVHQRSSVSGASAAAPSPSTKPSRDGILSAEVLQHLVDRAAHFNMFSMPDECVSNPYIGAPSNSNSVIGVSIHEALHRWEIITQPATAQRPLTARALVGERAGKFTHRWLLMPHDFVALPDREPPPTPLDPSRQQRFVMMDSRCTFGDGDDGFYGFGTGQTLPTTVNGKPQLLATAIGTITEGFGRFKNHEEGTYVYCGRLVPQRGFMGNVILRVMDRQETFRTESALPALEAKTNPEPGVTYMLIRGEAVPTDAVTPRLGPDGRPTGLIVEQRLRLLDLDFKTSRRGGLQSTDEVGQFIGRITASITFDPAALGGTALNPIPFTSRDDFIFLDCEGRRIGSFAAESTEGRVFNTQLSGQSGIRFGGAGRILSGVGLFEGINGLMTDNSVVVFAPHVSASVYVLRIDDPIGKFRITLDAAQSGQRRA